MRRAVYVDPETGKEDPAKKGICSNFLCDAKPGQEITMTGELMAGEGGWRGSCPHCAAMRACRLACGVPRLVLRDAAWDS